MQVYTLLTAMAAIGLFKLEGRDIQRIPNQS